MGEAKNVTILRSRRADALSPIASQKRRLGQALKEEEKRTYIRILKTANGLKLPHRYPNKNVEIAKAAGCDVSTVIKARKWGLRHGRG
jgi:hypothetical protein